MDALSYMSVAAVAYLIGSTPTGYLMAKARGVDIRSAGSGNIGATNAFRVLGKGPGIAVLLIDAFKGFAACWWAAPLLVGALGGDRYAAQLIAAVCVILGHNFTFWLHFKGGKGIATTAGVLLAMVPAALAIDLSTWLLVLLLTRYVSLASISAAFVLPFAIWVTGSRIELIIVGAFFGILAIYKHRSNIRRLMEGTESRFTPKKHHTGESPA